MSLKPRILICEDDQATRAFLNDYLVDRCQYDVDFCESGEEFLKKLESNFSVLLVDVRLPGISGLDVLKITRERLPKTPVIMMTAYSNESLVISCMRNGAYNYIKKPFNLATLKVSILEAHGEFQLRNITVKPQGAKVKACELVSKSSKVSAFNRQIEKIAKKNVSILLRGETGTGKEYYAQVIKKLRGEDTKLVAVNCPAIPKDLVESELFGHEKGSFTGAHNKRIGKFEQSDNGILFMDEIADLDILTQNKLLRSLQERSFTRVGGSDEIEFNTLLISATSRDLALMINEGSFREDLYFRIADVELFVVPLRERLEDLEDLIHLFASEYADHNDELVKKFTPDAIDQMKLYSWPGNLRELRSTVRKVCIFVDTVEVCKTDLPENIKVITKELTQSVSQSTFKENEKAMIEQALEEHRYNLTKVAKSLGIGRSTLYRKLKKFNIDTV